MLGSSNIAAYKLGSTNVDKIYLGAATVYTLETGITGTGYGNVEISTAQSKFGSASAYFDGVDDVLKIGSTGEFDFGADPFTIEGWVRLDGTNPDFDHFFGIWSNTNSLRTIFVGLDSGNKPVIYYVSNGGTLYSDIQGATALSTNTWYHIAAVGDGTNLTLYVNGIAVDSAAQPTLQYASTNALGLGGDYNGGNTITNEFQGWIDEFRVSNVARYTGNFTPATSPFVNDANTLALFHFEGSNGSTTFTDDNIGTGVNIVALGDAQISTAQSKFGGASALFDGTGDVIYGHTDYDFASDSWTFEAWVYPTQSTNKHIMSLSDTTSDTNLPGLSVYQVGTNLLVYSGNTSGGWRWNTGTISSVLTVNGWNHIAVVKDGSTWKVFVNGTQHYSGTPSGTMNTTTVMSFGGMYGYQWQIWPGYIDEARVSNTVRYTGNFTPQTAPFVNDSNTLLLLHMDGTDGSTTFVDDNS